MKKLLVMLFILVNTATRLQAAGYESDVKKGIEMMQQSETSNASIEATNYFERLSEIHKQEWIPLYYAAYSSLKAGFLSETSDAKDQLYKKGLTYLERAKTIRPNDSEILTLEAYLRLMYISNDAMKRAPSQTGEAMEILEKAKALNPANPRPWLVHGQNTLYTPAFFGGGESKAKPLLEKGVSLYKTFQPENDLMPVWGKERCEKLLEKCR
jgi:tetratricopeptide (TPR) repeat protein